MIGYLQDFLFSPERARSPVASLSGGERNRLLLARLFAQPANLLVLDEPTNDLDIETLELLEERLLEFSGTILLVSHDRAFVDNVVTSTLAFEGGGRVFEYVGGYTDWLRQRRAPAARGNAAPRRRPAPARRGPRRRRATKLSFKEQRELEALPAQIEALEARAGELAARGEPARVLPAGRGRAGARASAARALPRSSKRPTRAGRAWRRGARPSQASAARRGRLRLGWGSRAAAGCPIGRAMSIVHRAASTLLLLLVVGCDDEAPAEPLRVANVEPPATTRAPEPEPALDEPLRAPEPPPSPRSSFNRISSGTTPSSPSRSSAAAPTAAARAKPREMEPNSHACESARSGALRMQGYVESVEREIERLEAVADDIDYSARTREAYEARREAAEERLASAEQQLSDYLQNERQRGVPLGCLR